MKKDHIFERDQGLLTEKQRNQENLHQELERLKEILETTRKKATDLETAYEREEKAKNELYGELGSLEDGTNQIKELLSNAKVEIEDYKGILSYYKEIDESLKKNKEALKRAQAENHRLKENNETLDSKKPNK